MPRWQYFRRRAAQSWQRLPPGWFLNSFKAKLEKSKHTTTVFDAWDFLFLPLPKKNVNILHFGWQKVSPPDYIPYNSGPLELPPKRTPSSNSGIPFLRQGNFHTPWCPQRFRSLATSVTQFNFEGDNGYVSERSQYPCPPSSSSCCWISCVAKLLDALSNTLYYLWIRSYF